MPDESIFEAARSGWKSPTRDVVGKLDILVLIDFLESLTRQIESVQCDCLGATSGTREQIQLLRGRMREFRNAINDESMQ